MPAPTFSSMPPLLLPLYCHFITILLMMPPLMPRHFDFCRHYER
jgi:hypothetical protein